MCVSRMKSLAAFLVCFIPVAGWLLAAQGSVIVPGSLQEFNRQADSDPISYDDCRDTADPYWNDRGELIDSQGNITDAMTGKSMLGLEGLLLSNDAKDTTGNAHGENYEIIFQIDPALTGKARVYVMIGIRDVFAAAPDSWLKDRLDDNSYSPQMDTGDRTHSDRTWIGLDAYGVPIGSVFNRVLRRPAPDGRPMAFPCRDGVGEEYFAFYHDFGPGEEVQIYGCYSGGSNYFVFAEEAPPGPPAIWSSEDIGDTKTGDTQYNAATATWDIYADGGDIWGGADAFRYVYTDNTGDFLIQGRINGVVWANDWAKAGFMVRESTAANSAHASFFTRGGYDTDYRGIQYRASTGSDSAEGTTMWAGPVVPEWFRFERSGDTMTASFSEDAISWTELGTLAPVSTGDVLVGMAVTSHDANRMGAGSFSKVYVTGKGMVFAHAGPDQTVDQGAADATFTLDGAANSLDADLYHWAQIIPGTPVFTIADPDQPQITLDAKSVVLLGDTTFTFELTVTNSSSGATQTSTVNIFIIDNEQANAGPDQDLWDMEGKRVTLDGTGSRGSIAGYLWTQVGGPPVPGGIVNANTTTPSFTTDQYEGDTALVFKLTITGTDGGTDEDEVTVLVRDAQQAIADAGADQEGYEMRSFTLDARGSTTRDALPWNDPNISYQWVQTGGPPVYRFEDTDTATPSFVAPEIELTTYVNHPQWPPWRDLTFKVTVTPVGGGSDEATVSVHIEDAEFESVFYREHEDYDFHNSLVNGKWYPEEAVFGDRYCQNAVGSEVYGMVGRLDPNADYWWNSRDGGNSYRPEACLGNDARVAASSGTDWKCGWINPGAGDFWKYTFEIPYGSTNAYIVNWLATNNSWHGNSRAYYDFEEGNASPVGYFRVCIREWDNYAPLISAPFAVNPGLHRIMLDAYGAGEPNYARFELHVPWAWANIADAGPDKGAVSGSLVTLVGTGSQVTSTTYTWEQVSPDSPQVTLNDVGTGVATFTAPAVTTTVDFVFRLTVAGADNDSVDLVHVMIIPANTVIALYADQRTARDFTAIDWGNRTVGGAEWGSDYVAGNWGALPPGPALSSDVIVHHFNDGDNYGYKNCWSEFTFNLPAGSIMGDGMYYAYIRAAHRGDGSGNSAFVRVNEGVAGLWPLDPPGNDHYRLCEDHPYDWYGSMDWHWGDLDAGTIATPLKEGENQVRVYARESRCDEGRPYTWDALILSPVELDEGNWELMDAIARAAKIPVTLTADAGADFTMYSGETGVLDGTASMGAITTGWWGQIGGPDAGTISTPHPGELVGTFVAPFVLQPSVLTFQVTVGDGVSTSLDTVDVTVLTHAAPPAPTNLTGEGVELGVKLHWDPAPGAVSYTILRRESGLTSPFSKEVAVDIVDTTYIDRTMTVYMDQAYDYVVLGVNALGNGFPSDALTGVYALSANLALRGDAGPFAKKPHPGWTLGDMMKNRVKEESFDSWYYSEASADDWWGYEWPQAMYFQEIHYYPGNVFFDGGYWTSLGIQYTKDGIQWFDIPTHLVTITPPYDFRDNLPEGERSPAFGQLPYVRRHIIKFPRVEGTGVRIYGAPGGTVDFTSMAELEVYGVPGPEGYLYAYAGIDFSADEGTVATLDGSDSSTPLAVSYHWEQVTGAGGQVTQVDMTSAFNKDVIYAEGEDLAAQDPYEPGGDNWLYSSNAAIAPAGTNPLPADGKIGPYQLGPYTGRNCLLLSDQQRNGVVPVTPGNYGYLGVAFSGASGNHWTQLILNYANGDSPVIWFEFSDWFYRGDVERAWQNSFRVSRNDGHTHYASGDPGGPNIYHRVIPVDSTRTLVSVTFANFPGNGAQTGGVFAMNLGPPVPIISLDSPDSAVCTFTVPEISHDQTVTFRLTVWDAANNSATDEVDVLLMDTNQSRADAGADISAGPFRTATLDGSGTQGDIIWYRWEQIGGTAAVAIWNADQAQAGIIVPEAGSTLLFKVTAGAANGTVSSDTVIVRSAYPPNPDPYNIVYEPQVLASFPSVPSSGYIQDVLLLGANYTSRFTSNMGSDSVVLDHDHLSANGGQANQVPSEGDPVNLGGETFADGPAVWTHWHDDNGYWFENISDNYVGYFHVYIISPQQRDARCRFMHDDAMACWNNGSLAFNRTGWDGNAEQALDFNLFQGVNCMTFKLREGGGGDRLRVRFTDRSDNQYGDLHYVTSYGELPPPLRAILGPDPYEPIIVGSGELFYLDGRASSAGVNYTWEQVWPTMPDFLRWFADPPEATNTPILGAPWVDEDTDFYIRLWADDGVNDDVDVVKVTVATKELPGAVTNVTGEWAGDVGAVLRWGAAAHASRYNIKRAEDAAGPYVDVGTTKANMYVDTGALSPDVTYHYQIEPANILNVGTGIGQAVISSNANIANVAKSTLALPIVGQPNPLGGGSRDITLMKDGIVSGQNYDTYDGNTPNPGSLQGEETFEFFGYLFQQPVEIHSLVYYTGGVFFDGGWWTNIGVQVTRDGVTWEDAAGVVSGPVYKSFNNVDELLPDAVKGLDSGDGRSSYEKYIFSMIPDMVTGVRIAGHAGGSAHFVSIAELEAYGDIGGLSVNAGADMAVDELTGVTLDGSLTTGATAYQWECITDPTLVITNPNDQVASFTAPGVIFVDAVTFRLTASNAQWQAWDEVTFTVFDVDGQHLYRYSADFDGRTGAPTPGRLVFADGAWQPGYSLHDLAQHMRDQLANEAPDETTVTGNDYFFQDTSQSQTYRPSLNPFDVRYLGAGEVDPFIGYTTQGDWWNYSLGTTKTFKTSIPEDGVMYVSVYACTGHDVVTAEILMEEQFATTITFPYTAWGNWGWHPGTDSFLVTKGSPTFRVHLTQGGWDFCKFRFDLAIPAIEQVQRVDSQVIVRWSDVGRTYTLEGSMDLENWVGVYGPTTETFIITDVPAEPYGFYRIRVD